MVSVALSSANLSATSSVSRKPFLRLFHRGSHQDNLCVAVSLHPSSFSYNRLRFSILEEGAVMEKLKKRRSRGSGAVCYAAPLTACSLPWISAISTAVLMLAKGTAIQKSFLVPLFVLQAPASIITWTKSEYGMWSAFLALIVRLFFFIPGQLELPLMALLLVIVSPYHVLNLRGTQSGIIISLLISGYLAFQHFTRMGSLQRAFDQNSVLATIAIICVTAVSFLLLI